MPLISVSLDGRPLTIFRTDKISGWYLRGL
jgi:hypothetical protein